MRMVVGICFPPVSQSSQHHLHLLWVLLSWSPARSQLDLVCHLPVVSNFSRHFCFDFVSAISPIYYLPSCSMSSGNSKVLSLLTPFSILSTPTPSLVSSVSLLCDSSLCNVTNPTPRSSLL